MSPETAAAYYEELKELIHVHPADFMLKYRKRFGELTPRLAQQLNGMQKARKKLPSWFNTPGTLYPPNLNLEQCSSHLTATYKSNLYATKNHEELNGADALIFYRNSIDLTGGFGVDSHYLTRCFSNEHTYVEQDESLFSLVEQNFKSMNKAMSLGEGGRFKPVKTHLGSGIDYLMSTDESYDLIYIDPSRRVGGSKKFILEDCEPNVMRHQELLQSRAKQVMYKFSPLMDISAVIQQLQGVHSIHVLSVKNDCKELLVITEKEETSDLAIKTVNFSGVGTEEVFTCTWSEAKSRTRRFSKALKYLYEPNASVLKSGAQDFLAAKMGFEKLHPNTHLYTSNTHKSEWPGRIFETKEERFEKVNVISRNHPMTPKQLVKKYKLKEGDAYEYFLAFTDIEKPKTVFARRIY